MNITLSNFKIPDKQDVINLYKANNWSSAKKPDLLYKALVNPHNLITAWDSKRLVGLGNAISDGYLVVYYPHLLVLPEYQGKGIGTKIIRHLVKIYAEFHMQMLTADARSIRFYELNGFERAGKTEPMWVYNGNDH